MPFDLGDTWTLRAEAKDANGVLANADTVALTISLPDGTVASPSVTNPPAVTGIYVHNYVPATAGRYGARWVFTFADGLTAAYTDAADVRPAEPALIMSLADAKAHLNITSSTHDDELRSWLESVTEVIEHKVGPVVVRTYTDRVWGGSLFALSHYPVVSITSVTPVYSSGLAVDVADLEINEHGGVVSHSDEIGFTGGPWDVTYKAGRPIIPANISHAARVILKHLWETQRGAPSRPTMGGDDGTFDQGFSFSIPRRAVELLEPHMRYDGFA